jgi:ATP-binding cassette subfamily B protein
VQKKLVSFIVPYWKSITFLLFLNICSTILLTIQPMFGKFVIDQVFTQRVYSFSFVMALGILFMLLGLGLFLLTRYFYLRMSMSMMMKMKSVLYRHFMETSSVSHSRQRVGDMIARLNEDLGEAQRFYTDNVMHVIVLGFSFLLHVILLVFLSWKMTLYCFLLVPVLLFAMQKFRTVLFTMNMKMRTIASETQSFLFDTLSSIRFIRSAHLEDWLDSKYQNKLHTLNGQQLRLTFINGCAQGIPQAIILLSTIGTVWFLGSSVIQGSVSLGTLLAFSAYQARLYSSIQGFAQLYIRMQKGKVSVQRIEEFFQLPVQEDGGKEMPPFASRIEFRQVSFRYEAGPNVLEDITFSLNKGEKIAIVGQNGAGKSTLADLLVRLHRPSSGTILCDGIDIQTIARSFWNQSVCLVAHDHPIWYGTIEDYLQIGRDSVNFSEMRNVLEEVGLWEDVQAFPKGIHTELGEKGAKLSAGQKQRLVLARAFLQSPNVFIFDEAMCHLDTEAEQRMFDLIRQKMHDKTVLIITHRIQNILWVDRVWSLSKGTLSSYPHTYIGGDQYETLTRKHG